MGEQMAAKSGTGAWHVADAAGMTVPPPQYGEKGTVYTREWVVDLILDLAGYTSSEDLVVRTAVEPAAGEGAFLSAMIQRLLASMERYNRSLDEARQSLQAFEVNPQATSRMIDLASGILQQHGVSARMAQDIARGWVKNEDYLAASADAPQVDFVIGNPPYVRYDDVPKELMELYRSRFRTMEGRTDLYIAFFEAGLQQLVDGGVLAFICADRWMRSAYGAALRNWVSQKFAVDVIIEMHDTTAFVNTVAAYPAVVVLRRGSQGPVLVGRLGPEAENRMARGIADMIEGIAANKDAAIPGIQATMVSAWFKGSGPWPALTGERLQLLQRLETTCRPLADTRTGTRIGIGVATGADKVFITTEVSVVEQDRLIPLALATDTQSGRVCWSGHYLINPWTESGTLVNLEKYPKLASYFEKNRTVLQRRHTARKNPLAWYRTIDKIHKSLLYQYKLYFPDLKLWSHPTLDRGETYPHHNLYYLVSDRWDLEVLGGLLLSRIAQLFIEAYSVRMRGGTLRFQAQYLRLIRVPDPMSLSEAVAEQLRKAFRERNSSEATLAAAEAYRLTDQEWRAVSE